MKMLHQSRKATTSLSSDLKDAEQLRNIFHLDEMKSKCFLSGFNWRLLCFVIITVTVAAASLNFNHIIYAWTLTVIGDDLDSWTVGRWMVIQLDGWTILQLDD